jgi:hypothetical protein
MFTGRRKRHAGVVLGDDVLFLDTKHFTSCRIKISNLGSVPTPIHVYRRSPPPFSESYLTSYFHDNKDNPYGIWNCVVQLAMMQSPPGELPQLPPLTYPKSAERQRRDIERMRELARPGDGIFTFDRASGISSLIRKYDWGMWSHVAMVSNDWNLTESTTSGIVKSDFFRLCEPSLDVGLYRFPFDSAEEGERAAEGHERRIGAAGYNWGKITRLYLKRRFGIPFRDRPNETTPNGMIYWNLLRLVCYA